jgi:hypothetical protein
VGEVAEARGRAVLQDGLSVMELRA